MPETLSAYLLIGGLLMAFILWLLLPTLLGRSQDAEVGKLARMSRQAKRHNTMVRYYKGMAFVVSHQSRGLVYMVGGKLVTRAELVKTLGAGSDQAVWHAEQEESRSNPSPTRLTLFR
jgi:hypothetical protein